MPASSPHGELRAFRVMNDLGSLSIGEPLDERRLIRGCQRRDAKVAHSTVRCRQREPVDIARAPTPSTVDRNTDPHTRRRMRLEPWPQCVGAQRFDVDGEPVTGRGRCLGTQGGEQAFTENAELQRVEHLVDPVAIEGLALEVEGTHGQLDVAHELSEATVADHGGKRCAKSVASLTRDLVDPVDERVE